ncbi:MAG: hypothetical protein IH946_11385 [Bacteroidetes bacterium]|nr:hypothetical protein [Bacteroidota bacterium]
MGGKILFLYCYAEEGGLEWSRQMSQKWSDAIIYLNLRGEMVDLNTGTFVTTGLPVGDEVHAIVGGVSFRPSSTTVIKANYRYHWNWDNLKNPPAKLAGFQFGFASYF